MTATTTIIARWLTAWANVGWALRSDGRRAHQALQARKGLVETALHLVLGMIMKHSVCITALQRMLLQAMCKVYAMHVDTRATVCVDAAALRCGR